MLDQIISNIRQKFFSFLDVFFMIIILMIIIVLVRQDTQPKVPNELASHLGKMSQLQNEVTYRLGLLKYLAVQNAITKEDYWQAQNAYITLSAKYNGCLNGIIAKVELHNEVTTSEVDCLLEDKTFLKTTEAITNPPKDKLIALEPLQSGLISKPKENTIAHSASDDSDNQFSVLDQAYDFLDKVSNRELEREIKVMEVRQKFQSHVINLLEGFKWPDINQIRPQPLAVGTDKKPIKTEKLSFNWCKKTDLENFLITNNCYICIEDEDKCSKDKNELCRLSSHLRKEDVCGE